MFSQYKNDAEEDHQSYRHRKGNCGLNPERKKYATDEKKHQSEHIQYKCRHTEIIENRVLLQHNADVFRQKIHPRRHRNEYDPNNGQ